MTAVIYTVVYVRIWMCGKRGNNGRLNGACIDSNVMAPDLMPIVGDDKMTPKRNAKKKNP